MLSIIMFGTSNWVPSDYLLYLVLIMGALITAGVAMSVFSFYEDHYWGDRNFRNQLRFHPSHKNLSNHNPREI
ncbi:hypothetical protein [Prochlorococcus marinus]|uniref:hypothetical protein n=1 Tax=Prochlorococcus marinus TaxID=1219 RepID=UPI001ADC1A4A|nr:hypothetical protein [Prochlorococcus marinus]MBO8205114.1 hypothetical protein [Prochlorococcus marinus CUG1415]MBW3044382.1 hypothetical protein [Prochlorococcus marinus str. MU1415]